MTKEEVLDILKKTRAIQEGHFILTSGSHSPLYVEKFRILEQPKYTEILCKAIIDEFSSGKITVVVGPMTGGIILAYECARQLGVKAMFTERVEGKMQFRRGFKLARRDRVLIVEDVITTGGSVKEVIKEIRNSGAAIVGLGYIVDRSNGKANFDVTAKPLITMDVLKYIPEKCPLCESGIPILKPGSRK